MLEGAKMQKNNPWNSPCQTDWVGALKPDMVVVKRDRRSGQVVAIQVADVSVAYPGSEEVGAVDEETRLRRTLAGKADVKRRKYAALVEELQRRNPSVRVEFFPLVFASVGAVPKVTEQALKSLMCAGCKHSPCGALGDAVCSILKYGHFMWRARNAAVRAKQQQANTTNTAAKKRN
jgi:hypothetical protein